MIILGVRTDRSICMFELQKDGSRISWSDELDRRLSAELPSRVEHFLAGNDLSLSDIGGLVCFSGPGSYTGLRISHAWANAAAYSLGIPIVSGGGDDWFDTGIELLNSGVNHKIIQPDYGGQPNITVAKK